METKKIPICCITDKNYVLPTLVMLESLHESRKENTEYTVYILVSDDLSDDDRRVLLSTPLPVEIVEGKNDELYRKIPMGGRHVTPIALHKFELCDRFPEIDKLLYLDADILVLKDLSDLYETELGDHYAAAVEGYTAELTSDVHFEHNINSGVMLLNTKKMREDHVPQKLLDYRLHGENHYMDQDAFNAVFAGHTLLLPITDNLMYTSTYRFTAPEICRKYGIPAAVDWNELCERSAILHFNSADKPWLYQDVWQGERWRSFYERLPAAVREAYPLQNGSLPKPKEILGLLSEEERITEGPLVSIITVVKDCEPFLADCLDSILLQTYRNFEVIVVDGGSADASLTILEQYQEADPRISLIRLHCDSAGAARNSGLQQAKGKYIVFVDGDDRVEKDLLKKSVAKAEETEADLVCFPGHRYDSYNRERMPNELYLSKTLLPKDRNVFSAADIPDRLFQLTSYYAFSRLYRTEFLKEKDLRFSEHPCFDDIAFSCLCMAEAEKITYIPEPLYLHTMRNSKSLQNGHHADCFFGEIDQVKDRLSEELLSSFCRMITGLLYSTLRNSFDPQDRYAYLEGITTREWLISYLNTEGLPQAAAEQAQTILGALRQYSEKGQPVGTAVLKKKSSLAKEPLVSVIMPVYQAERYLEAALRSVLDQSFEDLEILCVDDGSQDRSLQILLEMAEKDPRISVFSQQHEGVSVARNVAIAHASGKYIYFMDSDDLLKEGALQILVQKAEEEDLDALFFDADVCYDEDCTEEELSFRPNYRRRHDYPGICSGAEMFDRLCRNNEYLVTIWIAFYRRSLIMEGNISFYPGIVHSDNQFTFQMMLEAERTAYLPETLYVRRIHPDSIMTSAKNLHSSYSYHRLHEYMGDLLERYIDRLGPAQVFSVSSRIALLLRSARVEYRKLDPFEKGRALALGNDYFDYRVKVIEPSELYIGQANSEKRNRKLSVDLADLRDAQKRLQNERKELQQETLTQQHTINALQKENLDLSDKLQRMKAEIETQSAKLRQEGVEKTELNTRLQQTYTEKSELNAKLQQTYKEKSEINAKLKQAYADKAERGQRIRELEAELKEIKSSRMYKVWKKLHS